MTRRRRSEPIPILDVTGEVDYVLRHRTEEGDVMTSVSITTGGISITLAGVSDRLERLDIQSAVRIVVDHPPASLD